MNPYQKPKIVQYWADNHIVVSGNHCRLIDNKTQKTYFNLKLNHFLMRLANVINSSVLGELHNGLHSPPPLKKGNFRADIRMKGITKNKTFPTKKLAET